MCGINGIAFSPSSGRHVDESKLVAMRDILHHRGPDDGGIFVDGNIGLGHRRLSIVDVAHGAQPMFNGSVPVRSCITARSIITPTIAINSNHSAINFKTAAIRKQFYTSTKSMAAIACDSSRHVCFRHLGQNET